LITRNDADIQDGPDVPVTPCAYSRIYFLSKRVSQESLRSSYLMMTLLSIGILAWCFGIKNYGNKLEKGDHPSAIQLSIVDVLQSLSRTILLANTAMLSDSPNALIDNHCSHLRFPAVDQSLDSASDIIALSCIYEHRKIEPPPD